MATGVVRTQGQVAPALCEVSVTAITSERFWPG